MGNKLGRKRQVVDEKYTRPQGLYTHKDVDHKKLRKLILESKLAPCYPGDEECFNDLEECPICFLSYPSLNRSRCCMKSICTECFLQMKVPNSTRPTQCPFCKTPNYAVEYRGVKTKEEKGLEQIEEQRVIEAKIRIRQKELQDEEERDKKRLEHSSSSRKMGPVDTECSSVPAQASLENEESHCFQDSCATPLRPSLLSLPLRANRDDEFDIDLEDIMVMEAIWLSIQEKGRPKDSKYNDLAPAYRYITESRYVCPSTVKLAESSSSPSGGLACAIAALAEHQQTGGESLTNTSVGDSSSSKMLRSGSSRFFGRMNSVTENYQMARSSIDTLPGNSIMRNDVDWNLDRGSEMAEAGTSYAGSDGTGEDSGAMTVSLSGPDESEGTIRANDEEAIVPESFEEQMMLAMAVSLAEARATSGVVSRVSW